VPFDRPLDSISSEADNVESTMRRNLGLDTLVALNAPDPLIRPVLLVVMVPCWQPIVPFSHGSSHPFL
jgi:hypothetical protein